MTTTEYAHFGETLYYGRGLDPAILRERHHRGVPAAPLSLVSLGTPIAADSDLLIKAATSDELPDAEGSVVFLASDQETSPVDNSAAAVAAALVLPNGTSVTVIALDVPRNLVTVVTASAVVAMTVTHEGYDEYHQKLTETHAITTGGTSKTVTGSKAFAYWLKTTVTVAADATGNTMNVGTGVKLGLPFRLEKTSHALMASLAGAQELINVASNATVVAAVAGTASATTGDVRGTLAVNGTLTGSAEVCLWGTFSGRNTRRGLAGVLQA